MSLLPTRRLLAEFSNRAIVYSQNGDPSKVLEALRYPPLPPPPSSTVNIRFILSPINPADLNVIEGIYPDNPRLNSSLASSGPGSDDAPVFVAGNEGLARITEVGGGVSGLEKGDWVIMRKAQVGTWCTSKNVKIDEVTKVPKVNGLSEVEAATMAVNPPTAYNMLHDFVQLRAGDWVVQNGANSAVGQAVIQIAAAQGFKTLNFVRPRNDLDALVKQLQNLGATKVLTYNALSDKSLRKDLLDWSGGKDIQLGLNCVGGPETTLMARLLGNNAHLVSYGAMSKQPLSLPTSLFIFKNLTCHGFWQSQWNLRHSQEEQQHVMKAIVSLISQGKLKEVLHDIVEISSTSASDEQVGQQIRDLIANASGGRNGKKALLRFIDD